MIFWKIPFKCFIEVLNLFSAQNCINCNLQCAMVLFQIPGLFHFLSSGRILCLFYFECLQLFWHQTFFLLTFMIYLCWIVGVYVAWALANEIGHFSWLLSFWNIHPIGLLSCRVKKRFPAGTTYSCFSNWMAFSRLSCNRNYALYNVDSCDFSVIYMELESHKVEVLATTSLS